LRGKLSLCEPCLFAGFPEYLTESLHLRSSGTSNCRLLVNEYRNAIENVIESHNL
jgi:hypothetical protein